ncbi:MAG: hypothetical protein ACREBC_19395 [Pyrinomonadaceae bacterium]
MTHLLQRHRVDDRTADLNVQFSYLTRCAVVLPECSHRQDYSFVQTIGLQLNRMPQSVGVEKGNDASRHEDGV